MNTKEEGQTTEIDQQEKEKEPDQTPPKSRRTSSEIIHSILYSGCKAFVGIAAILGVLAAVETFFGPLLPKKPEIALPFPSQKYAYQLPVILINRSKIFDISQAKVICYIHEAEYESRISVTNSIVPLPGFYTFRKNDQRSVTCDFEKNFNRGLGLGLGSGSRTLKTATFSIIIKYPRRLWFGTAEVTLGPYTWDLSVDPYRLVQDPIG